MPCHLRIVKECNYLHGGFDIGLVLLELLEQEVVGLLVGGQLSEQFEDLQGEWVAFHEVLVDGCFV